MFDTEPPDRSAFRELYTLVHHLADELASFRRRAISAEGRLRDIEGHGAGEPGKPPADPRQQRIDRLEAENAELRARLETAAGKVKQMHERVRFLRQQAQQGTVPAGGTGSER